MAGFDQLLEQADPDPLQLTIDEARALKAWLADVGFTPADQEGEE